ncbi:hypothetical protein [Desulfolutivibrio sp.]|uniref:hypothetical protein n=1 Tax=Desulfolutivibrio sp. TaxID=2773296 RepID=UPI002F96B7F5
MLAPGISRAEDHLGGFQPFFDPLKNDRILAELTAIYSQSAYTPGKHRFDAAAYAAATDVLS